MAGCAAEAGFTAGSFTSAASLDMRSWKKVAIQSRKGTENWENVGELHGLPAFVSYCPVVISLILRVRTDPKSLPEMILDHYTTQLDPNCIPPKQRAEADQLARQIHESQWQTRPRDPTQPSPPGFLDPQTAQVQGQALRKGLGGAASRAPLPAMPKTTKMASDFCKSAQSLRLLRLPGGTSFFFKQRPLGANCKLCQCRSRPVCQHRARAECNEPGAAVAPGTRIQRGFRGALLLCTELRPSGCLDTSALDFWFFNLQFFDSGSLIGRSGGCEADSSFG
ncbi:unnamed protein product [Symbiodinium sp. KB8]|nr:unnamed protein product [Symbiodinium sp. KB8]